MSSPAPASAAAAAPAPASSGGGAAAASSSKRKRSKSSKSKADPSKPLTKQQINQRIAREKQKAEAEKKAKMAAVLGTSPVKKEKGEKRKKPDASSSSSASSGSDSSASASEDESGEQPTKLAKPSADSAAAAAPASPSSSPSSPAATPAAAAAAPSADTKLGKKALRQAKIAARAEKKAKVRAEQEAAGTHPSQLDLQLMNRDNAAKRLFELYALDRRERGQELTPLELDEALPPWSLASLPNHEDPNAHSFKLLHKALRSVYGADYQAQVCGGTIQPALSTKAERFGKKQSRAERKAAGDESEVEAEEEDEVRQKQAHMDDPNIGAPYVVFITPSAIRAVEIGRAFKKIQMNTRVVKLFAKHLKIDQQREELSHDVRVAIGTPHRLLKLSQNGFLKWSRCRLVLWDIGKSRKLQVAEKQERRRIKNKLKKGEALGEGVNPEFVELPDEKKGTDRKMFTLLTLKDTKSELWKLYEQFLHEVLVKNKTCKLVLL